MLAAECNWNVEAQWDMFLYGLANRIQNEIYALELPIELDHRTQKSLVSAMEDLSTITSIDTVDPSFDPEPMQVGRALLSWEEEQHRTQGLCLYCEAAGHIAAKCPVNIKAHQ